MKGYYVTLQRGNRTAWLLGPFKVHQRAIDAVAEAATAAEGIDPRCFWDAHGTSSIDREDYASLPPGKLNSILTHLVVDA